WYTAGMAAFATILVDDTGPIARVTLNRPDKRNPISPATCGELVQALAGLQARREVRVVVLTGAGSAVPAGGEFVAMQPTSAGPTASLVDLLLAMHELGK